MRHREPLRFAVRRAALAALFWLGLGASSPPAAIVPYIEAGLPALLERFKVPGAAVALVEDGEIVWTRGYGWADVAARRPVTAETRFNIGSISKTVSAWGLMRLVEDGRLGLDEPLLRRLHSWQPPAGAQDAGVTLRRVLSHTAGLDYCCYYGTPLDAPLPTTASSLAGADLFWGKGGEAGHAVTVAHPPGTRWAYSGGGYTIAQLFAEEATSAPFDRFLRQSVLGPLGLRRTQANWQTPLVGSAQPYSAGTPSPIAYRRFAAVAAAGLTTTIADLARFAAAHVPGKGGAPAGRGVLKPETLTMMLTPAPASQGFRDEPESGYEQGYGLGYMVLRLPDGATIVGHTGSNLGWSSALWVMPEQRRALVLLTNSRNGDDLVEHWSVTTLALWHRLEARHASE